MRIEVETRQVPEQGVEVGTETTLLFPTDLRPKTISPLANCLGSDMEFAKHLLSVAEDAHQTGNLDLAEHFLELAYELFEAAFGPKGHRP